MYDAMELDRCRMFKSRILHNPLVRLTGATIECRNGVVTVRDASGNVGMVPYDTEAKRLAIVREIERGQRAEAMESDCV